MLRLAGIRRGGGRDVELLLQRYIPAPVKENIHLVIQSLLNTLYRAQP